MGINWDTGQRRSRRARDYAVEPEIGMTFSPSDGIASYAPIPPERSGIGLLTLIFACGLSVLISIGTVFLVSRATLVPTAPGLVAVQAPTAEVTTVPVAAAVAGEAAPARLSEETGANGDYIDRALLPLKTALEQPAKTVQRINALIAFNSILNVFAAEKGGYPNSEGKFVAAADALKLLNDSEFEENVPAEIIAGMRYASDGRSFKVLMLGTGDCAVARTLRPAMVDPNRAAGDLDCIAYGVWTPLGKDY